jgi:ATP-binding cassette subfamily F protein 3
MPPLSGSASFGHNVRVGYYRQGLEDLPEHGSVIDALLRAKNLYQEEARSYLARFLFRGDDVFKPVAGLSGGERSRLALARLIVTEPNVIVLDEPTTHLDIPSREALEDVLMSYEGTIIFVSHDRRFIALLAEQLWLLENGHLRMFAGSYDEWVLSRQIAASKQQAPKRTRQAVQQAKERTSAPATPDQAPVIQELEAALKEIEEKLTVASEQQDVSAIALLGEEHNDVRERLDQAWQLWLERDSPEE